MNDLGWMLLEAVCLLAGAQMILWVYNYGFDVAKQKLKLENQQPLVGLRNVGFIADSIAHPAWTQTPELAKYSGRIDGYYAKIFIKCQPASIWREQYFMVRVFFNPDSIGAADSDGPGTKNKVCSNFFKWQDGVMLHANCGERKMVVGRFSKPDSRRLFAAAQELAIELRKLGLNPADAS